MATDVKIANTDAGIDFVFINFLVDNKKKNNQEKKKQKKAGDKKEWIPIIKDKQVRL